jgi:CheY-like chemotaxis protein
VDETTLILHRVEANLPEEKRKMIRVLHDRESVFTGKTILVVDDDMRNVYAITNVLEEKGLEVLAAQNGQKGVDMIETNPKIDLVLMDIMMPEMDGYEAMAIIRKKDAFKKLPIIALTAKAMKGDRIKCIEAGASDYLAKPVNTDKLLSMMRVWLY